MAESSTIEVRLVRCPKCKNLLPEPKDCSFFQCGGCGTILCAKNKDREADPVSDKSVDNRAKETQVNLSSSEEELDLDDASLRHQQIGQTETFDVHTDDDPCSKVNVNDSQSGLDRFRKLKRAIKRYDSEGFRFSASNYFQDSVYSDEAIRQDRAGLVKKLDRLKEKAPLRFPSSGKHIAGPSYNHIYPPCHYNQNPDASLHGQMHNSAYGDPHRLMMHERALHPSHPLHSTKYDDGLFDTYQRNGMLHQSSCSCVHCYDPYHRASGSVFPPSGLPDALRNPGFYTHETSFGFAPLHSPRTFVPPPPPPSQSRGLGRRPNDLSLLHHHPKAGSASGCSRLINPVAGGAPFITCRNCFKILNLPDKTDSSTRKRQRLRCGACSYLIEFSFLDKKLVLLSTDPASERRPQTHRRLHWSTAATFSSDDYDNAPYEFHAVDTALISDKPEEVHIADSTSPEVSEDDLSSDSPLPLHKQFEYSSINGRNKKGGFASIVKNSFKDLKKSIKNESRSSDVSVNGQSVAERLVKMAEKQAGPIRPGSYWYDYRAGFWGVMGGQCLGILPPFIEELNYPMPEDCAGGTTRVYVNGRELHQKDLRLLNARGLPRERERSYTVYISGRVIDEDTGEELASLGKLAPTVDKLKRGFGMRVPRRSA
ncbi:unnamed protein product [Microthlaspi erraticum]|uniref:Uncharacterized protein n=1 Tax=Microthlaspi erraticum TaxID=1685480 RepID=A0A6D2HS72_9BRAS|nr:unnamed protein product [Microthlaspi erraticum]